jgi:SOS response regulatory protein OraA/RecX
LAEIGVVSDERYAALWVQSRLSMKADGPRKMLASLCNKGIDRRTSAKAIKDALDFETETTLLKRYIAKNRLEDANRRERRQVLKYEGFSADVIDALEEEE